MACSTPKIATEPWEVAKARFLDGLTTEDQAIFQSASLENLFYQSSGTFEEYKVDSTLWKAQIKLQPLLDAFEEYGKALDVYANTSSLIMGPLWGSLRVVLLVSNISFSKHDFDI
jgi:hypothetical protein